MSGIHRFVFGFSQILFNRIYTCSGFESPLEDLPKQVLFLLTYTAGDRSQALFSMAYTCTGL